LFVSIPRKGVFETANPGGLAAPLVRIDSMRRLYLNYRQTTWEELPRDLDGALRGQPAQVVYFDADNDVLFMDAARALDTIEGLGARAILVTPGSKARPAR
jgi:biopolymer transport protein ExbD